MSKSVVSAALSRGPRVVLDGAKSVVPLALVTTPLSSSPPSSRSPSTSSKTTSTSVAEIRAMREDIRIRRVELLQDEEQNKKEKQALQKEILEQKKRIYEAMRPLSVEVRRQIVHDLKERKPGYNHDFRRQKQNQLVYNALERSYSLGKKLEELIDEGYALDAKREKLEADIYAYKRKGNSQ